MVQFSIDNIQFTNRMLKQGQYFHKDVYREGILLFDSEEYKLNKPREYKEMDPKERLELAEKSFKKCFKTSSELLDNYQFNLEKKYLHLSAFFLHQVTENLLSAVELVFDGYKPPSHNLLELKNRAQKFLPKLKHFFFNEKQRCICGKKNTPNIYKSQKGLENICIDCHPEAKNFLLLANAYVDARYTDDYEITVEELQELKTKILELKILVQSVCEAEIERLKITVK